MIKNLIVNQSLTGFPHIDMPWMKWYLNRNIVIESPNTSITAFLKDLNKTRGKLIAQTYYGRKFTYDELFQRVDNASKALTGLGVKQGDIVFNLVPTIPEAGHLWLGASQIGAISDYADPRPDSIDLQANARKMLELIRFEKADYIVALDICYTNILKPIEQELKEMGLKNIVIVSASDSMNIMGIISYLKDIINYNRFRNEKIVNVAARKLHFYEALMQKIINMSKDKENLKSAIQTSPIEIIRYSDLVRNTMYTNYSEVKDSSLVSYIGHTSGTSGARPKPIPLTNANLISSVEQTIAGGYGVQVEDRVIHELPFFSPLGACNNYLIDLACGANLFDVPEFEISEFGYLIKKYKPNVFLGTPSWLGSLPSCSYLNKIDLSAVTRVIYGGDSMTISEEQKLNSWLTNHKCRVKVEKGHGMSEYCGGGTYAVGQWNYYGSMGIPFPKTIYGIVDPNIEDRLVPINTPDKDGFICGELVVSSDAVTSGKLHGQTIVKHYEMDGKSYIRTRDIVKMNSEGVFFFESRKDRSFTRFDGYKVKPSEIEKEIEKHQFVKCCIINQYYDEQVRGNMPIAHIVLEDGLDLTISELVKLVEEIIQSQIIANPNMSSRQIPSKFKFRKGIPLTKNSKINYQSIASEPLDGNEICVEVEETNMSVGEVHVYPPMNMKVKKLR